MRHSPSTPPKPPAPTTWLVEASPELGGARVHAAKSGVVDGAYENDFETLSEMRRLMEDEAALKRRADRHPALR